MMNVLTTINDCSSGGLSSVLATTQRIIRFIQIIAPILLILMASIHFIQLLMNPDNKKELPKLKNSFIAAFIIFFVPMFVDVLMMMLGDSFSVTACWNAVQRGGGTTSYIDPYGQEHHSPYTDPSEFEKGNPKQAIKEAAGVSKGTNGKMSYFVYLPPNPTTNMPLLIWLHGDGGSESNAQNNPLGEVANSVGYPAIVVSPHSPGMGTSSNPGWFEGGHLAEVKAIADEVCNKYKCDKSNINIGGHSRGAIGTWMMVSSYPGYFHAAAPISCCSSSGFQASSFQGVKVWAMRGSGAGSGSGNDDIYGSCMQSSVNAVKPYAKELKYTILPNTTHGGAGSNAVRNQEMIKFIFSE